MKNYSVSSYPSSRLATFDVGIIGGRKHHIAGLMEIDVTDARRNIRRLIRSGTSVSFNSWLIKCIADALGENPQIQGMMHHGKILSFDQVDISLMVEREIGGSKVPLAAVLRDVNRRDVQDINSELEGFRKRTVEGEEDYVLSEKGGSLQKLFFKLPQFIRISIFNHMLKNPFVRKERMGTAIITNVGSAGNISGWIIPRSIHNICFAVGSINKKPWVHNNEIAVRDILHLTILFDHNIIDGAPAARFAARLKEKLENENGI